MKNTKTPWLIRHKTGVIWTLVLSLLFNIAAAALVIQLLLITSDTAMQMTECRSDYADLQRTNEELVEALSTYTGTVEISVDKPPRYFVIPLSEDLQDYIWSLCCDYGIADKYEIVYALIKQESSFDAASISSTDDYGLMQINISNHWWLSEQLGVTDFLDPYQNVHCGIYMIASLLHNYSIPDALMVYNMSSSRASHLWDQGIHSTNYTDSVMYYYEQFTGNI